MMSTECACAKQMQASITRGRTESFPNSKPNTELNTIISHKHLNIHRSLDSKCCHVYPTSLPYTSLIFQPVMTKYCYLFIALSLYSFDEKWSVGYGVFVLQTTCPQTSLHKAPSLFVCSEDNSEFRKL